MEFNLIFTLLISSLVFATDGHNEKSWSSADIKLLTETIDNLIPIGMVYTQMPKQKSPQELWPLLTWKDITSNFKGAFFRAEGENSAAFGKLQEENTPRLVQVDTVYFNDIQDKNKVKHNTTLNVGEASDWVYTGNNAGYTDHRYVRFVTSSGEVRPSNMAVRVWKRVG